MHRSSSFPSAASAALVLACAAILPAAPLSAQIAPGSTLVFTGVADVTDVGLPGVILAFDKRVTADPAWAEAIVEAVAAFEQTAEEMTRAYDQATRGLPATEPRIDLSDIKVA